MIPGMDKEQRKLQLAAALKKRWGTKTYHERFWERVEYSPCGCWLWKGQLNNKGYGQFWIGNKAYLSHRMSYAELAAPIPEGFELDHMCRVVRCLNPAHVVPVTHRENMRRSKAATKMACKRGHDWTNPHNVYIRKSGTRWCAACQRELWSPAARKARNQ